VEVIIKPDALQASVVGAKIVERLIRGRPDCVLGLATGESPLLLYRELVRMHLATALDFSRVTTFNLDEYVGVGPEHPGSYHRYMWEYLFGQINIARERIHIPDGLAADVPAACDAYERAIHDAGGIDLQILGIGADGHVAFNEPSSSLASRTRIKSLTPQTLRQNARLFGSEERVPRHVITMGIGTILEARECVLLAFGERKAQAIAAMVEGPITALVPASALQLHRTVKVLVDEAATSRLQRADYYRWVYENKPTWQRLE
jgi:glucosamine-6-phosphate deaminase